VIRISARKSILDSGRRCRLISYSMYCSIRGEWKEEEGQLVLRARIRIPRIAIARRGRGKMERMGGRKELLNVIDEPTSNIPLCQGQLTWTPRWRDSRSSRPKAWLKRTRLGYRDRATLLPIIAAHQGRKLSHKKLETDRFRLFSSSKIRRSSIIEIFSFTSLIF